jgi:hypothetical protein
MPPPPPYAASLELIREAQARIAPYAKVWGFTSHRLSAHQVKRNSFCMN